MLLDEVEKAMVHRFAKGTASAAAAAVLLVTSSLAFAQSAPDSENGRYTFSQIGGDLVRLDTRTGAVSTCTSKGGWVCRLVPDERTALDGEIGRLQADNKLLKDQLAQRDAALADTKAKSADAAPAKPADGKQAENKTESKPENKIELTLPADHQQLMALIDKVWDRLIDMAARLQKRLTEKT